MSPSSSASPSLPHLVASPSAAQLHAVALPPASPSLRPPWRPHPLLASLSAALSCPRPVRRASTPPSPPRPLRSASPPPTAPARPHPRRHHRAPVIHYAACLPGVPIPSSSCRFLIRRPVAEPTGDLIYDALTSQVPFPSRCTLKS